MRIFGDQERVWVDGEPGTVVASPMRDCYQVELDSGDVVSRTGATLEPLPREPITAEQHNKYPRGRFA